MGLCLIAASDNQTFGLILSILQIAVGLGLVIFVHELGHFAVAKWCGVKCEKFYLGFDIYGLKLARFRWGETEYGIGILPLGGYVKMLGQEDNPARVAEEIERAKTTGVVHKDGETASLVGVAADGTPIYDPRSYLSKSVPQRMAIISAGVIMNVIFAFGLAALAYRMGVQLTPAIAGGTSPGGPAWAANIQAGDDILRVGDVDNPLYRDIINSVVLGDAEQGVSMLVRRFKTGTVEQLNVKPIQGGHIPQIGLLGPRTRTVLLPEKFASQSRSTPPLETGDVIVGVEGQKIDTLAELAPILAAKPEAPLRLSIERTPGADDDGQQTLGEMLSALFGNAPPKPGPTQLLEVTLEPRLMRGLGLVMEMGPIFSVQTGSPAEKAGIKPGDLLLAIDGQPVGDPMTLPDRLRKRAGETISLTVQRLGEKEPLTFENVPVPAPFEFFSDMTTLLRTQPVAISGLGLAYEVRNCVAAVEPGGPADKAGLKPGTWLTEANFKFSKEAAESGLFSNRPLGLGKDRALFPALMSDIQILPEGTQVVFTAEGGQTYSVTPVEVAGWYNPDRGLITREKLVPVVAKTWGAAFGYASYETKSALLQVYGFLRRIGTQIDVRMLGGPITIFKQGKYTADRSLTEYMLFLTLLSANLAVINFLPIPILDGGHMVFLALEWIRGKPVGEKVVIAFHYAGFLFIVSLMIFVLGLDVGLIPRGF